MADFEFGFLSLYSALLTITVSELFIHNVHYHSVPFHLTLVEFVSISVAIFRVSEYEILSEYGQKWKIFFTIDLTVFSSQNVFVINSVNMWAEEKYYHNKLLLVGIKNGANVSFSV